MAVWFAGRVPDGWFAAPPEVEVDRDEIVVTGRVPEPAIPDDADEAARAEGRADRLRRFGAETRAARVRVAREAEARFGRKVSWGAVCGDRRVVFTNLAAPVMTRLRMDQRVVLDTLIEAGVARSRSEALAWCVRLVGQHQADWIAELREALVAVERARAKGPGGG